MKGQTLIETAFVLVLLLVILFGIAEFSRAWFTKSSLKNAVRTGARFASVANVTATPPVECDDVSGSEPALFAVCNSPGVPSEARVSLRIEEASPPTPSTLSGDTVTVEASYNFSTSVSGLIPQLSNIPLIANASMRHE